MGVRRSCDHDRVDAGECERVGQRRVRVRDLEARRAFRGLGRITSDEREHVETRGSQRAQMRDAPESGADDGYARHASLPLVLSKRGS